MARNHDARLGQLERRSNRGYGLVVIGCSYGGATPDRYETPDGKHSWQREPGESPESFQRRVSDDVERIANHGVVVFLPFNGRGQ
jgi:hypothetical protein